MADQEIVIESKRPEDMRTYRIPTFVFAEAEHAKDIYDVMAAVGLKLKSAFERQAWPSVADYCAQPTSAHHTAFSDLVAPYTVSRHEETGDTLIEQ